ncbi:MAG: metallophosphoesterase family protein [Minwuia sp.]|uniref:metallophosphoesterase family protein n=1 Tax=Minwuia sp. TaxID=2493630 RepID=UPI003A874B63
MRIAQISDTHLSDRHGFFVENFRRTAEAVNAWKPDLVIHTGDLSINGADRERDLSFSMEMMRLIEAPLRVLPGNHDIGEEPGFMQLDQPTTEARLARYTRAVGTDRWAFDAGDWRLIGLNAQVLGTGLAREAEQAAWLADELEAAAGWPVGIFTHKPLFFPRELDGRRPRSIFLPAGVRARTFSLFRRHRVRFVASGHLHKYLDIDVGGVRWLWAPATAYKSGLNVGVGHPSLGFLKLELTGYSMTAELCEPEGLVARRLTPLKGGEKYLKDAPPAPPDFLAAD